jgi:outer membrane protein
MGRLEGVDLDPTLTLYDPVENYDRVRDRGGLPWDGLLEALDRILAPAIMPATDAPDAPIDQQLKSEIVQTAPRN